MRFLPSDVPVLDTKDLAFRDPLARVRPYSYAVTALVLVVMSLTWDSGLWWLTGVMAAMTPYVWRRRASRKSHIGLGMDAFVCAGIAITMGLPFSSMAFPWASYIVAGYILYTRSEARVVVSAVVGAAITTVALSGIRPVELSVRQVELSVIIAVIIGIGLLMSLVPVIALLMEDRMAMQSHLLEAGERRVEMQQQFTSMVSHELRSPLTSIKGFSQLLAENSEDFSLEDRVEIYRLIDREAENLSMLVDDILLVMRFDAGNLQVAAESIAVRSAADEIMLALDFISDGHDVVVDVDPSHRAIGDDARVKQVIRNLVTNAFKYGGTDIRITSSIEDSVLRLSVKDNGSGIPAELKQSLFDPFSQGSNATASTGFGLGLGISRRLASAMNGELEYQDLEPTGACFTLALPAAP